MFIGRTDAEAETPILWPPYAKSWLIGKNPDAGRDWGQEEKGTTEDEMAAWHPRLDGHEFGWNPGIGDGQGGLACCNSWGCKESDTTEAWRAVTHGVAKSRTRLSDWTELNAIVLAICDTHEWVCDDLLLCLKPAFMSSNQNHCFHGINHIFCDIPFRIVYMFTRKQQPSSHWATKAVLPVITK